MALCHNCDDSRVEYTANGTQTVFEFEFSYNQISDIGVANWNEDASAWESVSEGWSITSPNITQVVFDTAPEQGQKFIIYRCTDISPLPAEFYPGTAIKAQDLNDNFLVLSFAIEDTQCDIKRLEDEVLKTAALITEEEQTTDGAEGKIDDDHIFSAAASKARHDSYVQESVPPTVVYEQPGKLWQNTDDCWTSYWQQSVDPNSGDDSKTWVAYVNTGPRGEQGPQGPPGQSIVGPPGPEGPEGPSGGTFPDAPADGTLYGRKDNNWEHVGTSDFSGDYNDLTNKLTFTAPLKESNGVVSIDLQTIPNA